MKFPLTTALRIWPRSFALMIQNPKEGLKSVLPNGINVGIVDVYAFFLVLTGFWTDMGARATTRDIFSNSGPIIQYLSTGAGVVLRLVITVVLASGLLMIIFRILGKRAVFIEILAWVCTLAAPFAVVFHGADLVRRAADLTYPLKIFGRLGGVSALCLWFWSMYRYGRTVLTLSSLGAGLAIVLFLSPFFGFYWFLS